MNTTDKQLESNNLKVIINKKIPPTTNVNW